MRGPRCFAPSSSVASATIMPTIFLLLSTARTVHTFTSSSSAARAASAATFSVRSGPTLIPSVPFSSSIVTTTTGIVRSITSQSRTTTVAMNMARPRSVRGLEQRREGLTPMEGGMTLYLKAGPDGTSVGDCPFAHYIRLVLEEKGLEYDCKPTPPDGKPMWLIEHYDGKLPALRHRKECYVESNIIVQYLDYFFPTKVTSGTTTGTTTETETTTAAATEAAEVALEGFFPAVAGYLKDVNDNNTPDGEDGPLRTIREKLQAVEDYLTTLPEGSYLCGTDTFSLVDCRFVPQLYHLIVGIEGFKGNTPNIADEYPKLFRYWQQASDRPSFHATVYPKETILWGWGNARK